MPTWQLYTVSAIIPIGDGRMIRYVENVAAAIVLASLTDAAAGRVYNVGEEYTPTIEERLRTLPPSSVVTVDVRTYNFRQDIAYDTTRIRRELGYGEIVPYELGLKRTLSAGETNRR